ncbi:hypothetical protein PX52LOC_03555 [Limnoglobus roseus]|uniref:Uncharacterized protein n=1 Tax=Limnoglobus roseus TaxID=2598579 RepID=A0A5C1AD73_9BACT|nr:hypothetical protein PX52LOC_03555 [Limnoglobus roseus]
MPATVPCPTCKTPTKVPAGAEPGTTVACPSCDEQFVPKHLKTKSKAGTSNLDDDGESSDARNAEAEAGPREREDGYGKDLRKRKRRRGRESESRSNQVERSFSSLLGWIGVSIFVVFILVGMLLTSLRTQVPTAGLSCLGIVVIPLVVAAWLGRLLEHR